MQTDILRGATEIAHFMNLKPRQAYHLIEKGLLQPVFKFGGILHARKSSLLRHVKQLEQSPTITVRRGRRIASDAADYRAAAAVRKAATKLNSSISVATKRGLLVSLLPIDSDAIEIKRHV